MASTMIAEQTGTNCPSMIRGSPDLIDREGQCFWAFSGGFWTGEIAHESLLGRRGDEGAVGPEELSKVEPASPVR